MRLSVPRNGRLLATIGLAASLTLASLSHSPTVLAHGHAGQESPATDVSSARQSAQQLTQALMALQKHWASSKGAAKAQALDQLIAKAEERQQLLAELIRTSPEGVLRVAIPENKQQEMPEGLLPFVEQHLVLEGEFVTVHEDYEDGHGNLRHILNTPFGEHIELHFTGPAPQLQSGTQVRANGVVFTGTAEGGNTSDGEMVLQSDDQSILTLAAGSSTTSGIAPAAGPYTFGEQKTLVILVNFQDKPQQPWTQQQVQDVLLGSVNDFYLENSGGQTWFNGDVTGWFTIPMDSTTCDQNGLSSAANNAAANAGFDLSSYRRLVYAFPRNACGWSGLGVVGGSSTRAWLNGSVSTYTFGHELGHNLGLGHSSGLECGSDVIEGSCFGIAYGNHLDIMGGPNPGHFNALQKERLGWLDQGLVTVTQGDTFTLDPYEANGSTIKTLKVLQSTDSTTGQQTWYYIEFRQAMGADSFITTSTIDASNVLNGVVISRGNPDNYSSSALLDMTPGSQLANDDFNDPALEAGQQFNDTNAGIAFQTNWVSGSQANVSITTNLADCTAQAPSVSLTPPVSDWVSPGSTVVYSVTLTDNDNQSCGNRPFDLSTNALAGWSLEFSSAHITLAPGESVTSTFSVTSPLDIKEGFYDFPVNIMDDSGIAASGSITYVVSSPNNAPVAMPDSAQTNEGQSVSIVVLVNDSDVDGDTLLIDSMSQASHGSLTVNPDRTLTYVPDVGYAGSDSFTYTITDGKGGYATTDVSVEVSSINVPPLAMPDSSQTNEGQGVSIVILENDSDVDGDTLQIDSMSQASHGSLTVNPDQSLTYIPDVGYAGSDSFTYTITDGKGGYATADVAIEVLGINEPPVATDDLVEMSTESTITVAVLDNDWDPDNDTLSIQSVTQPSKGSIQIDKDGTITYTPAKSFKDSDSFTYTITDGVFSSSASVTLNLTTSTGGSTGSAKGAGKGNLKN